MEDNRKENYNWIVKKIDQLNDRQLQLLLYYIKALISNTKK